MSRVLLFCQTGDARPKCAKRSLNRCSHSASFVYGRRASCGACYGTGWCIGDRVARADRWWLVECENAEAGRAIITHDALLHTSIGKAFEAVGPVAKSRDPNRVSEPVPGRILAQGGRP